MRQPINPETVVIERHAWVTWKGAVIEGRVYAHKTTVIDAKNFDMDRENLRAQTS